jgi:hypothetical protein
MNRGLVCHEFAVVVTTVSPMTIFPVVHCALQTLLVAHKEARLFPELLEWIYAHFSKPTSGGEAV